jgi:hypothetical protein
MCRTGLTLMILAPALLRVAISAPDSLLCCFVTCGLSSRCVLLVEGCLDRTRRCDSGSPALASDDTAVHDCLRHHLQRGEVGRPVYSSRECVSYLTQVWLGDREVKLVTLSNECHNAIDENCDSSQAICPLGTCTFHATPEEPEHDSNTRQSKHLLDWFDSHHRPPCREVVPSHTVCFSRFEVNKR